MNILIVDDREENLYLLETLLKANSHSVQSAANGKQALERLKAGDIDMIISDILMPVMDGFQLCRHVKTDETLHHIPFIVYTATYTGPQDEEFAKKIGADLFLVKPCEPEVFMESLREVAASSKDRKIASTPKPLKQEEMLKLYSERLVRKLEQKMLELEKEVQTRQETEEFLRAIFKAANNVALVVTDLTNMDAMITDFSPGAEQIFGYTAEEAIGKPVAMLHRPEDIEKYAGIRHHTRENREGFTGEVIKVRKSGEQFPALFSLYPILNKDGDVIAILSVTIDITAQIRTEKALRESEEKYRAIFDGAAEGIRIIDRQTKKFTYVNPAMCRMLGYTEDELRHMTVRDIMPPEVVALINTEIERHDSKNKSIFLNDIPNLKKDGTIIYTDVALTPRIVIDGRHNSIAFSTDITEKKKAEDDIKKIEEQLRRSQKLEALGRLTGGIAHDFNNILTTIIGNADMMLMDVPKDNPMHSDLEEIKIAGDRAASLISQLLAFSRKQILQPTVMNLNDTVNDMDKMLRRIIGEDIELSTILAPDLGQVEADEGQIEQVIMNLAVNARDAMPRGGKVTIETANTDIDEAYTHDHVAIIPGPYVMLAISDTGTGMNRNVQENLFEPFFTTKSKEKGTGLGLSTVYGIVKQSNGNIYVYSEPGKGTTLKVYLPRVEKSIVKKKKAKRPKTLSGSETILVVEDNEMVGNLTMRILKQSGYRVLIAPDGREALRVLKEYEGYIHLVLTDVVMPGMSGEKLEKKLKAARPDIKVLFMSGYTDNAVVHHGLLSQGKVFLQKPFTPEDLTRKIREVLEE